VVTTYFNREHYRSRRRNFDIFVEALDATGVPHLTVECVFDDAPFALPPSPRVLRRRTTAVCWQKERLLNVAVAHLPASCRYIAWLDADVLFDDPRWTERAIRALEERPVVQLFDRGVHLPHGCAHDDGNNSTFSSFGSNWLDSPGCEREGWIRHGHTGFAWAARRNFLESCGLFDLGVTGGGDHLMAHGFVGDVDSPCIDYLIGIDTPLHRAFVRWATAASVGTGRAVGIVPGRLCHLWHGNLANRRYAERAFELKLHDFDPATDISIATDGCFEWTGSNRSLERWARRFFADRREDDVVAS
jgi:hypothetical protein